MSRSLTRHPEGSIRELWSISLPLMISNLATLFMVFTDRIFLAHYSTDALNASVNAGTFAWALMSGVGAIAGISEVFVAQYNGAGEKKRLARSAWQMIWFSLFSFAFFLPMGLWGGPMVFSSSQYSALEVQYFRWLMIFAPSYALMMAFSGFFIGRGKTRMMIWLAILANVLNILLDWALIYGAFGIIPELGIQGAAMATCSGYLFEALALAFFFWRKKNRVEFGTSDWRIDWSEMKKCLKVGFPPGASYALEIFGWSVFFWMMTGLGEKHITIASICQSFTILFSFFYDGLSRGAATVAGNFLGAKRDRLVSFVLRSGLWLLGFFSVAEALLFLFDPIDIVRVLFIENLDPAMQSSLKTCMVFIFFYLFFEGLHWLFSGLLLAAGDTLFLLIAGSLSVWIFLLAPIYFFVVKGGLSIEFAMGIAAVYSIIFAAFYALRFFQGSWKKIDLVSPAIENEEITKEDSLHKEI